MKKKKLLRKLSQMERSLRDYNQERQRHSNELARLRGQVRRNELLVSSGLLLMVNDVAKHTGLDASLEVERSVEQHNVTTTESGTVQYVPGLETYNVTYRDADGREWHNGVPEERWKV